MNRFIFALILSFSIFQLNAASLITGRIVDANSNKPIEFATVAVVNPNNSKNLAGALTNQDGVFNISSIPEGNYQLRVSFVGYTPLSKEIKIQGPELKLGNIPLLENSKMLKEVQVVGQGSQMRFDVDKKVFSVDQNIASAGGSATDVLQNIPSVDVDNDGTISLRNNSNVEVWINGKPSGLTADNRAQVLQQMPADNIESIEVITNPSAKYNPEGTAGIINLVLKKDLKAGYYGSASAGVSIQNDKPGYNAGLSINYNKGKLDAFANIGFRQMNMEGTGFTDRKNFINGDTTRLLQNSTNDTKFNGTFFRAGLNYRLDKKNTVGITGFGHLGNPSSTSETEYTLSRMKTDSLLRNYSRTNNSTEQHNGFNIELNHQYDIDDKGSSVISSISYAKHINDEDQHYVQDDYLMPANNQDISQSMNGANQSIEFKSDFTKKYSENNRLELGVDGRWNNNHSEADGFNLQTNLEIPAYYNLFKYSEQIYAAYATYGTRIKNLSLQGGLRGEYMNRNITSVSKNETTIPLTKSYFQLFPSAYISYSLPKSNEIQLNYTRRINRPRGGMINPYRDYSDSTNISYGNPELTPEFASALELNYIKNWEQHTLSSSIYYRYTDDVIQRISYMRDNTMESTFMNLTKEEDLGIELVAKDRLFKILNLTTSVNMYYNKIHNAEYINPLLPDVNVVIPAQDNFSWDARMIANIMFSPSFSGQVTGRYQSSQLLAQGERAQRYSIDLGLRKTFLDKKLGVNLNVRDLLNSRGFKGTTWGDGFYQYSENRRMGRMLGLTVTYNFGNMKPKHKETPNQTDEIGGGGEMPESD